LSGAAVGVEYLRVEVVIAVLREQYVVATVTAKIVSPKPF
jgi:hypothetical protein